MALPAHLSAMKIVPLTTDSLLTVISYIPLGAL